MKITVHTPGAFDDIFVLHSSPECTILEVQVGPSHLKRCDVWDSRGEGSVDFNFHSSDASPPPVDGVNTPGRITISDLPFDYELFHVDRADRYSWKVAIIPAPFNYRSVWPTGTVRGIEVETV